jgi:soluble lytic murein transglycosylase-like protein
MGDAGRQRTGACLSTVRALLLASILSLVVSCSGGDADGGEAGPSVPATRLPATGPTTGPTSSPTPPTAVPAPSAPDDPLAQELATDDPVALAAQLDRAVSTVRDPNAAPDAVRQAAELQQLAIRVLSRGSGTFRRSVVSRLQPATGRETRAQLRAARLLTVLTEPRRRFPPWRILEPPPPGVLLGYYREAQRRTGVPWSYLAAIHLVETRMGRIRGPSTAGALGPMQFLPTTWAKYGAGGDINDPRDAILAAARLLADHGAPRDLAGALWHYNPSAKYVGAVTAYARTMQESAAAYRGYWHWQVYCQLRRGAYVLPVGYPDVRPVPLPGG